MLGTVTIAAISASKIITYGFLLGVGFWTSKKLTNMIDEQLLLHDKKFLEQLGIGETK